MRRATNAFLPSYVTGREQPLLREDFRGVPTIPNHLLLLLGREEDPSDAQAKELEKSIDAAMAELRRRHEAASAGGAHAVRHRNRQRMHDDFDEEDFS